HVDRSRLGCAGRDRLCSADTLSINARRTRIAVRAVHDGLDAPGGRSALERCLPLVSHAHRSRSRIDGLRLGLRPITLSSAGPTDHLTSDRALLYAAAAADRRLRTDH